MTGRVRRWLADRFLALRRRLGRWAVPAWLAIGLAALVVVSTLVGLVLVGLAPGGGSTIDFGLVDWVAARRSPSLTAVARVVTDVGDTITLLGLGAVVGLAWRWRRGSWTGLVVLVGAYLGATAVYSTAKPIVGGMRPPAELALESQPGLSFPSGHAMGSAAVYLALALLLATVVRRGWRRRAIVGGIGLLVVLIGASRVYLGVHWVADVAVGILAGATWAHVLLAVVWAGRRAEELDRQPGDGGAGDAPVAPLSPGRRE